MIGEFIALQWQFENDPAGLADVLNDWFDIEDDDLVRQEEVEMALAKEQVQPTAGNNENPMEIEPSSDSDMAMLPEDSSDPDGDSDSEVQPLTRTEALNSVNVTEGIEMAKKLLQIMTSLDEDEASHMLARVYACALT